MYKKVTLYDYNDNDLRIDVNIENFDITFLTLSNNFEDVKKLSSGVLSSASAGVKSAIGSKFKKFTPIDATSAKNGFLKIANLYAGAENIAIGATGASTKQFYTGSNISFPLQLTFKLLSDHVASAVEKMDLLLYWSLPKDNVKNKDAKKARSLEAINSVIKDKFDFVENIAERFGAYAGVEKEDLNFFNFGTSWLGLKFDDVLTLDKPPLVITNISLKPSFETMDNENNPRSVDVNIALDFLQVPTNAEFLSFHNIVSELGQIQSDLVDTTREVVEVQAENIDVYTNCELNNSASIPVSDNDGGE